MHDGCLVTPVQKSWHRCAVGACRHVTKDALVSVPSSHGPEGPIPVGKKFPALEPGGYFDLAQRSVGVQRKGGQEPDGTQSQTRDTDERQTFTSSFLNFSATRARITRCKHGRPFPARRPFGWPA